MAQYMNKAEHKYRSGFIEPEINRLIQLIKAARSRVKMGDFLADIYPDTMVEEKAQMKNQKNIQ